MHEVGICEGLMDLVTQQSDGRPVSGVRLRIGARHAVVPEAFQQAFALASAGTVADGAALELTVTPVALDCRTCGEHRESTDPLPLCVGCGASDVAVSGGDELVLESLRYGPVEEGADVPGHPR